MDVNVRARAPGRVTLIGDHTDYTGGLSLAMAVDLETVVSARRGGERIVLRSESREHTADLPLRVDAPGAVSPTWARYVAGVVAELRPAVGLTGHVSSTLPIGAGLSSSAALEVAVALALGADPADPTALARRCQAAEHAACGVPCGLLDQLCITAAQAGHALLIDCATDTTTALPLAEEVDVVVLHGGEARSLASSAYAQRRAACERVEQRLGRRLGTADLDDVARLDDPVLARRARHVVTENERVRSFADALRSGDWVTAGKAMTASHTSLAADFEVSTPRLDALVSSLLETPGVFGARLTGAGFGGCVVALTEPGAVPWTTPVRPSAGASVSVGPGAAVAPPRRPTARNRPQRGG